MKNEKYIKEVALIRDVMSQVPEDLKLKAERDVKNIYENGTNHFNGKNGLFLSSHELMKLLKYFIDQDIKFSEVHGHIDGQPIEIVEYTKADFYEFVVHTTTKTLIAFINVANPTFKGENTDKANIGQQVILLNNNWKRMATLKDNEDAQKVVFDRTKNLFAYYLESIDNQDFKDVKEFEIYFKNKGFVSEEEVIHNILKGAKRQDNGSFRFVVNSDNDNINHIIMIGLLYMLYEGDISVSGVKIQNDLMRYKLKTFRHEYIVEMGFVNKVITLLK